MNSNVKKYVLGDGVPVYQGSISKYKGKELEKRRSFYIRPLTIKDCAAMEDLSVCIYDSLKEGQECFIHKHDREYYRNVLSDEKNSVKYVGVFVGRELVAMSYVRMIDNEQELQEELPNNRLRMFANDNKDGAAMVAAFGSDSVHPDFRGNRLNATMIDYRMDFSKSVGATDWVSIIDRKNVWNMKPYFDNGFNMFASSVDPADNGKIALMHQSAAKKIEYKDDNREKMSFEKLTTIDKMFYMNRVGVDFDKETKEIVFAKTDYYTDRKNSVNYEDQNSLMLFVRKRNYAGK